MGVGIFESLISLNKFSDMLLELLRNEDKYGLGEVSGMMGVCFQMLTCLAYESAYNDAIFCWGKKWYRLQHSRNET